MNHTRLLHIKIPRRTSNEHLFLACFYLMIVMTIFNGNAYLAGLSFVWLPSFLLLGVSLFIRKQFNDRLNILALALLISAAISTHLSVVNTSYSTYINLQFCILSFIIIGSVQLSDDVFKSLLKFYMNFGLLICLILIFNYMFHIGVRAYTASNVRVSIRLFGVYKDVNYLSAFILPAFAHFLYTGVFQKRRSNIVKAGIIFIAIFLAGSRSCFLAMVLSAALIMVKIVLDTEHHINKPLIIVGIAILAIALYLIVSQSTIFRRTTNFSNYSSNARVTIWSYAMNGFYARPIIGSGVEAGSYYSLLNTRWKTHNCFIDILTGQGLIGAIIMLLMFSAFFKVNKSNTMYMILIIVCFFVPLFFVNGYECATFWIPMTLVRLIYMKAKEHEDIMDLLF